MGVTATTAQSISVGAGEVFYKDGAGLWQPIGATKDNNVFRVVQTFLVPKLNGVIGPIKGIDYITEELAELEFTGAEIDAAKLALMIPGSASVIKTNATVGGGAVGTLADAAVVGQSIGIKVSSITSLSVGDYISIGATGVIEYRQVTRVGTVAIGGTGIDVDFPLQSAHALGEAFTEVDGDGSTIITPAIVRRLPSSAYHDYRLDVPGLDGRVVRFLIRNGIMDQNAEFTASDADAAGPRLKIQSRIDAAASAIGSWQIQRGPAFA